MARWRPPSAPPAPPVRQHEPWAEPSKSLAACAVGVRQHRKAPRGLPAELHGQLRAALAHPPEEKVWIRGVEDRVHDQLRRRGGARWKAPASARARVPSGGQAAAAELPRRPATPREALLGRLGLKGLPPPAGPPEDRCAGAAAVESGESQEGSSVGDLPGTAEEQQRLRLAWLASCVEASLVDLAGSEAAAAAAAAQAARTHKHLQSLGGAGVPRRPTSAATSGGQRRAPRAQSALPASRPGTAGSTPAYARLWLSSPQQGVAEPELGLTGVAHPALAGVAF